jgi:prophage regulatory protein
MKMKTKTARATVLPDLPPHKTVLRRPAVLARIGMKRTALDDAISRNEFPRPFQLTDSGRAVAWLESDVDQWLASRLATRTKAVRR